MLAPFSSDTSIGFRFFLRLVYVRRPARDIVGPRRLAHELTRAERTLDFEQLAVSSSPLGSVLAPLSGMDQDRTISRIIRQAIRISRVERDLYWILVVGEYSNADNPLVLLVLTGGSKQSDEFVDLKVPVSCTKL